MSDVLVDYSTDAPYVYGSAHCPPSDDYDDIEFHCLLSLAHFMLQPR